MTTVPGHNQIFQQSGFAQEVSNQSHTPKPGPGQAIAVQEAREVIQKSSVQSSEESERLKQQRERREDRQRKRAALSRKKRKSSNALREENQPMSPDAPGQLLDTTI